jgi:hypothetical protein
MKTAILGELWMYDIDFNTWTWIKSSNEGKSPFASEETRKC